MRSITCLLVVVMVLLSLNVVNADYAATFITNAQVTIGDGNRSENDPRDGIPDTFYPSGIFPPALNAFDGSSGNNIERRGVIEYDVSTLSGVTLNSAVLRLLDSTDAGSSNTHLSTYFADGEITLSDWSRLDTFVTTLAHLWSPLGFYDVDITPFVQSAIDNNESYLGFVLWQSFPVNGMIVRGGTELMLRADVELTVPLPLEAPPIPEPCTLALLVLGGVVMVRRRRAR